MLKYRLIDSNRLLTVMGIINDCMKQHITIFIDEVLSRSGRGSLTGSLLHLCHR